MTIAKSVKGMCAARGVLPLIAGAIVFAPGCAARVYSEPVGAYPETYGDAAVVSVDTAPVNIEAYPHYYYGGGYAYYVDGRWYRHGSRGWGYYRQEPPELYRQRTYVQQAPAAQYRGYGRPGVVEAQPRRPEEVRRPAPAARRVEPREERHEEHHEERR
jgi:hypothetical protein